MESGRRGSPPRAFAAAGQGTILDLLGALLIGVTFSRYVLADGPLAAMTADELIAYLTPLIRGILLPGSS